MESRKTLNFGQLDRREDFTVGQLDSSTVGKFYNWTLKRDSWKIEITNRNKEKLDSETIRHFLKG